MPRNKTPFKNYLIFYMHRSGFRSIGPNPLDSMFYEKCHQTRCIGYIKFHFLRFFIVSVSFNCCWDLVMQFHAYLMSQCPILLFSITRILVINLGLFTFNGNIIIGYGFLWEKYLIGEVFYQNFAQSSQLFANICITN